MRYLNTVLMVLMFAAAAGWLPGGLAQAQTENHQPGDGSGSLPVDHSELQRYVGDFWEPTERFAAETRLDGGRLWAVHSPERRNELVPVGLHRFRMQGLESEVIVTFTMSDGGIKQVTQTIDGQPRGTFTPFTRRRPTVEELQDYAGEYHNAERDIDYRLDVSGGRLLLEVQGQHPVQLTAMFDEIFEHPELGSFEFMREDTGAIGGFVMYARGSTALVFDRH